MFATFFPVNCIPFHWVAVLKLLCTCRLFLEQPAAGSAAVPALFSRWLSRGFIPGWVVVTPTPPPRAQHWKAWKDTAGQGPQQVQHRRLLMLPVMEGHGLAQSQGFRKSKLVPETRTVAEEDVREYGAIRECDTFVLLLCKMQVFLEKSLRWEICHQWRMRETVWSSFWCDFDFSVKSWSIFWLRGKKAPFVCVEIAGLVLPTVSKRTFSS